MKEITKKFLEEKCKKVTLPNNELYFKEDIPFYEYLTLVNGEVYRRFYIVDMTDELIFKLVKEKLESLDYDFFSHYFLDLWFSTDSNIKWENNVIFMTDENLTHFDPNIESNWDYARKRFVRESDLLKLLQKQEIFSHDDLQTSFVYNDKEQNLSRFNVIYGYNGSGKTRMLNEMSKHFDSDILNNGVDNYFQCSNHDLIKVLSQIDYNTLIDNYKRLWNYSLDQKIKIEDIYKLCSTEIKLLLYAAKLSTFGKDNNKIVLLDDIGWNGYDSFRTLNFIEYLSDLSLIGNTVVCTTVNQNVQKLMCRKTYKPNLIDLNKR